MLTRGSKKYWGVCDGCQRSLVNGKTPEEVAAKLRELAEENPLIQYTPQYGVLCETCSADPRGADEFSRAARRVARHYGINPLEVNG